MVMVQRRRLRIPISTPRETRTISATYTDNWLRYFSRVTSGLINGDRLHRFRLAVARYNIALYAFYLILASHAAIRLLPVCFRQESCSL
jgi:hypothetical protein